MNLGNQTIKTINVDGSKVDIVGCYDSETPEQEFDFYALFVNGECINMGEPFYHLPTRKDIRNCIEVNKLQWL
jgi:hypothetical protein